MLIPLLLCFFPCSLKAVVGRASSNLACILETVAFAPFLPAEIDVNDRDSSSNPIQSD